jgi:hypothetical protein
MNRYISLVCALLCLSLAACEEAFLDRKLDTNYTQGQVFSTYATMRDFGLGMYASLPQGYNRLDGAMLASATDDAEHAGIGTAIQQYNIGSWGPFTNPDEQWANLYAGVRKTNVFLENTVNYKHIIYRDTLTSVPARTVYYNQANDMRFLRAEARFLRAFQYFELIKRYGGVPLITTTLATENDAILARNSFEQVVAFIVSEIDAIAGELRLTWVGYDTDRHIGRATKGAALALKSRTLLYAASPLFNPGNDVTKWEQAAAAAQAVILLNRYSLAANYRDLFRAMQSSEMIFERRYPASNGLERANYPVGFEGAVGGTNPSQNLVNAYETLNGLPVSQDPAYNPQNPFANRDPRLQMTVIVNNADYKGRKIEIWPSGKDGPGKPRATRTGYYLKKFSDEGLDLLTNKTSSHAWVYFRYAETLLNYAEAMNEAFGPNEVPPNFTMSAKQALNMVRKRTGVNMPNVTTDSQVEFSKRIKNERRVELAFEEHRFWDVRRWKIGPQSLGSPIYGISVTRNTNNTFSYQYPTAPVENRVFEDKMYLFPIPRTEIDKTAGKLVQNPGW